MAVFTKNLKKHIFIHPGEQHKIHNEVRMVLMRDRKKYSDSMEGALLDVSNIKVIGDRHLIVHGYLSMEVMADFQIFAPAKGMTLQGCINKVHRKYCGCVTMDFFNVTLSYPENFDVMPQEGDMCSFIVGSVVVDGDMFHLKGQLTSIEENQRTIDTSQTSFDTSEENSVSKRRKSPKIKLEKNLEGCNGESSPHNLSVPDDVSGLEKDKGSTKKHKKKSKKDRSESSNDCDKTPNSEIESLNDSLLETSKSPKKQKAELNNKSATDLEDVSAINNKSSKKKSKRKSKENSFESSESNWDTEVEVKVKIEPADDSISENSFSSKKKHKKKSKDSLEFETNHHDTTVSSELEESVSSGVSKDKSKKKSKKRRVSENEEGTQFSLSPVKKIKAEKLW